MSAEFGKRRQDSSEILTGCTLIGATIGWVIMTALRETPIFWHNSGGYPVGLRMFVLDFYQPITAVLLLAGVWRGLALLRPNGSARRNIGLTLILWTLLMLGIGLMAANNMINLIEGRPLHWHPTSR